jgi:hypothetical protein
MSLSPTQNITPTTTFSISFSDASTSQTAAMQVFTQDTSGRVYACKKMVGRLTNGAGTLKAILGSNIQYFSSIEVAGSIGSSVFYQTATIKSPLSNARAADGLSRMNSVCQALQSKVDQASAKANTILANLAVEPVAILSEDTKAKTRTELWAEYNALPVEARNDFYAKHRDSLRS